MKLLLTSNGVSNYSIVKALGELLGKPFEKCSMTFIPTAANIERGDKKFVANDINNLVKLGFSTFDVMDISAVGKEHWLSSFETADLLVFGGGDVSHLLMWLKKSGVQKELPRLLKIRVYMGISSGSIIAAETVSLSTAGILYYEDKGTFTNEKGLGLVDFEIRPHLNSPDFPKVRIDYLSKLAAEYPTPFYAIDDTTAVKVDGENVSVISEGKWKKFN
jgi:dipeptidase E